ncbi:conserved hypothetical protein [Burkholderia pseudomallei MSHR346]|nr:conserved hypothetical protein [Burkholderia pseudomallei MSHR346]
MLSTETARLDAYSTLIPRHPGKRGAACFVLRASCGVRRAASARTASSSRTRRR